MATKSESSAMALVEQYYKNYGSRVRELKKQGNTVIGYLCALTPVEIITAAGLIPFRIKGTIDESISKADTQMETLVCSLVRSSYDVSLKKKYDFMDGIVIPHACDSISRTYPIWKETLDLPYSHFVNMPHGTDDSSLKFLATLLETFRKSLGKMAGKEITNEAINKAIELHNEYRRKVRDLYELRRTERLLISASDITKVLVAGMSLPVEEAIDLVSKVITEAMQSSPRPLKKRLMVVGAEIDSASFMELVESSGADVVNDDLCPGMREYIGEVKQGSNPLEALANHYLLDIKCARTFRDPKGDYQNSLEERFGHIRHRIKDFNVEGVIIYIYKYCDPFGFEVPAMKSYIEALGIPVLHLEDDYSSASYERLRTRIQAFIEMIGQ